MDPDNLKPVPKKTEKQIKNGVKHLMHSKVKRMVTKEEDVKKDPYLLVTNEEVDVIKLLKQGETIAEISRKLDLKDSYVRSLIKRSHVVEIMRDAWEEQEFDLRNMNYLADQRAREIIVNGDDKTASTMIQAVWKANGRFDKKQDDSQKSGEQFLLDLVKGNNIENVNVQINNNKELG